MTHQLLPPDFEIVLRQAIAAFWRNRSAGVRSQGGSRGNVIAGKNLDGFLLLVQHVARHCGVPASSVFTQGRSGLSLPGYFRPTKVWDVVVVHEQRLLAVLEFKSQVGSFGNNFNNRAEESIGSASDLWMAAQHRAFVPENHTGWSGEGLNSDPRPPFLGYLMLLEKSEDSTRAIPLSSPHYRVFPEFQDTSYATRYRILCERLMEQHLYSAAALLVSPKGPRGMPGEYRDVSKATSARNFFCTVCRTSPGRYGQLTTRNRQVSVLLQGAPHDSGILDG